MNGEAFHADDVGYPTICSSTPRTVTFTETFTELDPFHSFGRKCDRRPVQTVLVGTGGMDCRFAL